MYKLHLHIPINCISTFLICFLLSFSLSAFNDIHSLGARSAAIGNSSVVLTDIWSIYHNQAGIAHIKETTIGISYENRFLLPELGLKGGAIVVPIKRGALGVSISSFGYSKYSESKYGLSYGYRLSDNFSTGIQLNYLQTKIADDYGSKVSLVAEAGIIAKLNKELAIGAHIFNPNRAKLADYNNEHIPTTMQLGLQYDFSDKVALGTAIEKDIDYKPSVKVGIEYHIIPSLYLRIGISSNPFMNAFGFGLIVKRFNIDVATSYHSLLGYSPEIAISFPAQH